MGGCRHGESCGRLPTGGRESSDRLLLPVRPRDLARIGLDMARLNLALRPLRACSRCPREHRLIDRAHFEDCAMTPTCSRAKFSVARAGRGVRRDPASDGFRQGRKTNEPMRTPGNGRQLRGQSVERNLQVRKGRIQFGLGDVAASTASKN